jgi:hypothetical protein
VRGTSRAIVNADHFNVGQPTLSMKKFIVALLALFPWVAASAAPPFQAQAEIKLELPSYSLLGSIPPTTRGVVFGGRIKFVGDLTLIEGATKGVATMRVVVPQGIPDKGMPIFTPAPNVDFKILIRP